MIHIEIPEAEKIIDELLDKVISGSDEVVFTRDGEPVAKLVSCNEDAAEES